MPKFLVTKSVDAFVNYETIIEAETAENAAEIARLADKLGEGEPIKWVRSDVDEFQHTEYDEDPEEVADDFTLEPNQDLTAELLAALKESVEFHEDEENEIFDEWLALIAKAERR